VTIERLVALLQAVLAQLAFEATTGLQVGLFYAAASIAFQTAGVLLSLRCNLPRVKCPLRIRRSSSMPAIVAAAVLHRLKPSIGPIRSFTRGVLLDQVVQVFQ
jgi:hypothetical protein